MPILLARGAGYIGSHTAVELMNAGHDVVIVDNYSNSSPEAVRRIGELTHRELTAYEANVCDEAAIRRIMTAHRIDCVIHFAGLKAVGESVAQPARYYRNNLLSTLNLIDSMKKHGVGTIVFSSSATVYGSPKSVPIREDFPLSTTNPYGETKLMIERILDDCRRAGDIRSVSILRYFNPIGAHESGMIGEDPKGIPNNLLPYISQVSVGKLAELKVYGDDYPTHDGTGVRDYIHVVDLARAHLKAIERANNVSGTEYYNIGTGVGYSVLDIVKAYEKATGRKVPYQVVGRRPGDIAECYADPTLAAENLAWHAEYSIERMCSAAYRWQSMNPDGYGD